MPNKLRSLSGDDCISILTQCGFSLSFTKGSHCKMTRITPMGKQIIVIPRHESIAKGTLKSIYNKALSYVTEDKLKPFFYTD